MSDGTSTESEQYLDARMEYTLLVSTYTSLANLKWIGYGAFFTLNTLLATGFGYLNSTSPSNMDLTFINVARLIIPMAGIVVSMIAIKTVFEITNMMLLTNERGRELESLLSAKFFDKAMPYSLKKPIATIVGSLFFLVLWTVALIYASAYVI